MKSFFQKDLNFVTCSKSTGYGIFYFNLESFNSEYEFMLPLQVKRLCDAMNIKIEVTSDEESNCFSLIFDK